MAARLEARESNPVSEYPSKSVTSTTGKPSGPVGRGLAYTAGEARNKSYIRAYGVSYRVQGVEESIDSATVGIQSIVGMQEEVN